MHRELAATRSGRAGLASIGVLAVAVAGGLVVLWPSSQADAVQPFAVGDARQAEISRVDRQPCRLSRRAACQLLTIRLQDGPDTGRDVLLTMPGTDTAPRFDAGDRIRVLENDPAAAPGPAAAGGLEEYSFADFERRTPLYLLALLFGLLVVALARWKGVRALLGLAISLGLVTQFMVPAILEGSSPVLVALVGALAIMLVTVGLAHGTGITSIAAVLGSTASLLATALLAGLFVGLASITGFSSEEASLLRASSGGTATLSLQGLVLAGMVVGALGVLDDVTVSQASTVLALRRADPRMTFGRLFREGLSVGRDHLSATVNTLVLAYVGAALPVLLIFENQGTAFGDALNRESVAGEVVAMLVGSIGLVLAVPLTTALAAWLAGRVPHATLPEHGHAHAH